MSTFPTAVQDFVADLRHGPREQMGARFAEVMTAIEQAGPEEASWALLAVVELLADPRCPYQGFLAALSEGCMARGASPWVATSLVVERLCEALEDGGESRAELDLLGAAAAPLLSYFTEARRLFHALGGTAEKVRRLAEGREALQGVVRALQEHAGEAAPPGGPGAAMEAALARVAEASARGPEGREETATRLRDLMDTLFCVDLATRNRALAGLGRLVADRDPAYLGEFTQTCGSLVEVGCDPTAALDPVLARLPEILQSAERFLNACLEAGRPSRPPAGEKGPWDLLEEHGARVAERLPAEARAWEAVGPMCLGAIAMLARSPARRQQARHDSALLAQAHALAGVNGSAVFLAKMLQVLDDEELVVLAPEPKLGFRVRTRGVGDNFQLHTLLAGALVGPAEEGRYPGVVGTILDGHAEAAEPGRPLDRRAVGVARDLPCTRHEASVYSHLQLWTWQALRPDGRLPEDPIADHGFFVWNEGVPADIPPFEGVRVILLGSVPFSRSWNGGRVFPFMAGDLRVEQRLPPEAVDSWLRRIATALASRGRRPPEASCPSGG
jgi:hypothetical protein